MSLVLLSLAVLMLTLFVGSAIKARSPLKPHEIPWGEGKDLSGLLPVPGMDEFYKQTPMYELEKWWDKEHMPAAKFTKKYPEEISEETIRSVMRFPGAVSPEYRDRILRQVSTSGNLAILPRGMELKPIPRDIDWKADIE